MIRPATAADCAAIAAIWNPIIRDTAITFTDLEKTGEGLAQMLAEKAAAGFPFLVADDGGVLGFATYGSFRTGPGYARTAEHTILLGPQARRRGVGRALMAAIEDHARGRGIHSLWAGVSAENPVGRAFHAAIGYAEVAVLPQVGWKFGRWLDLVLMQKILG
jgi:phosphinothricin acetyltransferase